jgi:murein tripeptide amidase MpaA
MVIITNYNSRPEVISNRKAIILTSRVHPGESNASYMMEGTLEYLVSEHEGARFLRDLYVFKIIPMLNPDGVIVGNYRCSLSGLDLNRQWVQPANRICPENYQTKIMMQKTQESREILFYCDYHGHSSKKDLFMYGCSNIKADRLKERIFPMLYDKNYDHFKFEACNFNV